MKIIITAPAKINLTLNITGKLENNYHTISSIMHTVSLHDIATLTLTKNNTKNNIITLSCSDDLIPQDVNNNSEKNIAYKSATAFFAELDNTNNSNNNLDIYIEKNIPQKAGLGGGSADGAAVLLGLNQLYDNIFSDEKLCQIGAKIGADITFLITKGTCLCEGIGDKITKLPPLPACYIIIAKGQDSVSTVNAYNAIDKTNIDNTKYDFDTSIFSQDIYKIADNCSNIFEEVIKLPDIFKIKDIMANNNALVSQMSGSGSAVFGIFDDFDKANKCFESLREMGFWVSICKNF